MYVKVISSRANSARECSTTTAAFAVLTAFVIVSFAELGIILRVEAQGIESLAKRADELRAQFARNNQQAVDDTARDRKATVDALLSLITAERGKPAETGLYHFALAELGKYPDQRVAMHALVDHIDAGMEGGPLLAGPAEYCTAAKALIRCGPMARSQILFALRNPLSERKLHIMAYVLVQLDQNGDSHPFEVDLTILRLTHEIDRVSGQGAPGDEWPKTNTKNIRAMISKILEPGFSVKEFPPLDARPSNRGIR